MSELNIDEAIASGDPDLIEKAMAQYAAPGDDDPEPIVEAEPQAAAQPTTQNDVDVSASSSAGEEVQGVLSKDGNHLIPFNVLDSARAQAKGARAEAKALSEELAQAREQLAQLNNGKNAAAFEELSEISPEIATAYKAMEERVQLAEANVAMQVELHVAKLANPELIKWEKSDPERYALAVQIDNNLRHSGDYNDIAMQDRFAEVVNMVKAEYGELITQEPKVDPIAEKAAAIVAKHKSESLALPKTLTDVGAQHSSAQRSQSEIWSEKSVEQIAMDMENMTPAQRNQVLAGII